MKGVKVVHVFTLSHPLSKSFYCSWINFAVLTCTARTPPVVEQWGDEYPLFR